MDGAADGADVASMEGLAVGGTVGVVVGSVALTV